MGNRVVNELTVIEAEKITDFSAYPTEFLSNFLEKLVSSTAKSLYVIAKIYVTLDVRGVDLSHIKTGLSDFFPQIARGRLSAELAFKYPSQKNMLKTLSALSIEEQDKLAHGEPIKVVEKAANGEWLIQEKPLESLRYDQIKRVFSPGKMRTIDEQKEEIQKKSIKRPGHRYTETASMRIEADTLRWRIGHSLVQNGSRYVTVMDILETLSGFYGKDIRHILRKEGIDLFGINSSELNNVEA